MEKNYLYESVCNNERAQRNKKDQTESVTEVNKKIRFFGYLQQFIFQCFTKEKIKKKFKKNQNRRIKMDKNSRKKTRLIFSETIYSFESSGSASESLDSSGSIISIWARGNLRRIFPIPLMRAGKKIDFLFFLFGFSLKNNPQVSLSRFSSS